MAIGPLHDSATWYGKNYARTEITQWDFKNKGKAGWTGTSFFVLEVQLRYLRPSIIYSVRKGPITSIQFLQLNDY